MIVIQPSSAMQKIMSVFALLAAPGPSIQLSGFSNGFTSYLLVGEQIKTTALEGLVVRFHDSTPGFNVTGSSGFLTNGGAAPNWTGSPAGTTLIRFSDALDNGATGFGSFRMWIDDVLQLTTAGNHCGFSGVCGVPVTAPFNGVLPSAFAGSLNSVPAGKVVDAVEISLSGGSNFSGVFTLYGIK